MSRRSIVDNAIDDCLDEIEAAVDTMSRRQRTRFLAELCEAVTLRRDDADGYFGTLTYGTIRPSSKRHRGAR